MFIQRQRQLTICQSKIYRDTDCFVGYCKLQKIERHLDHNLLVNKK